MFTRFKIIINRIFRSKAYITLGVLLLILISMLWLRFIGLPDSFSWEERISFWSLPSAIVSLLTFGTLGRWLYNTGFYKKLYESLKGFYQLYKAIKAIIWATLMGVMAGVLYICLWVANVLLNIGHNVTELVQVVLPTLLLSFLVWVFVASLIDLAQTRDQE